MGDPLWDVLEAGMYALDFWAWKAPRWKKLLTASLVMLFLAALVLLAILSEGE